MNELADALFKSLRLDINNSQGLEAKLTQNNSMWLGAHTLPFCAGADATNAGTHQLLKKPSGSYHTSLLAFILHALFFPPRFMISDYVGGEGGSKYTFLLPETWIGEGAY